MCIPVYILAGGKSSRFGSDKARALVDGQPLIRRIADAVASHASRVTVVADAAGKFADLGLTTIADSVPDRGPMGGLLTALLDHRNRSTSDWLLLLSCDLLYMSSVWIDTLLAHRGPGVRAVAFRPDRWQPLLALYHATILPQIEACVTNGSLAMQPLLEAVSCVTAPLPLNWPAILQANTPAELAQAVAQDHSHSKASLHKARPC